MILLIIGLLLWTGLHLMRATKPDWRAALQDRMGDASKGVMAAGIVVSLILMVLGYRAAPFIEVWSPPGFFTHINNLLMVLAFYIYLTSGTKPGTAFVFGSVKNPQLTGFKVWAVAHLLVNGDLASVVLFGGLLAWAVVQVIATKGKVSLVDRSTAKITSPYKHLGLVVGVFVVVAIIHALLGKVPFGG